MTIGIKKKEHLKHARSHFRIKHIYNFHILVHIFDFLIASFFCFANKIRTRQTTFFGHVMRREKLEHLITTGMMKGKRSRGKQREKMTDGLANWLGAGKVVEILKATGDRGIWKDMIANAIKHGTG